MPLTWGSVNAPHEGRSCTQNRAMTTTKKIRTRTQVSLSTVLAENWRRLHAAKSGLADRPLADALGIGHGTIARLRAGSHATTIDTLATVAERFGVEPWMLLVPDFDPDNPPALAEAAPAKAASPGSRRRAKEKVGV